jgi:hypothetical protein
VNIARSVITTSAATGRSFLHVRRWFVSLIAGAALSVGFVAPAGAAGGPPIGPVYDCYTFPVYAQMTYFESLQLKSTTTYFTAPDRKGNSLSGPILKGTYRLSGARLTFLTGTFSQIHWYGLWKLKTLKNGGDQRHIGMYTPKGANVMECYPPPY